MSSIVGPSPRTHEKKRICVLVRDSVLHLICK